MNKRIIATKTTKPAKLKYKHPAGTPVTVVDVYKKSTDKEIIFTSPKVDGLYIEKARELIKKANKKRIKVFKSEVYINPTDTSQGRAFKNTDDVLDFFSLSTEAVILLFSAVEFVTNYSIENVRNLKYEKERYASVFKIGPIQIKQRKRTALTQDEILYLSIKEKLNLVLPKHFRCDPTSQQDFWASFVLLKRIRNDVLHATRKKTYGASHSKNSVFAELFDVDLDELLSDVEQMIGYIETNFKS